MTQIETMTDEVVDWIKEFIPDEDRDPFNTAIKMSEEVAELLHALYANDTVRGIEDECADILILLLDVAYLHEIDLAQAFKRKMDMNRERQWSHKRGSMFHD